MEWANRSDAARDDAARDDAAPGAEPQSALEADDGPGVLEVEEYRGLLRSAEEVLDAVDRALVQLDEGSYGTCEACGEPIEDARLEADPTAQRCARHDVPAVDAPGSWPAPATGA